MWYLKNFKEKMWFQESKAIDNNNINAETSELLSKDLEKRFNSREWVLNTKVNQEILSVTSEVREWVRVVFWKIEILDNKVSELTNEFNWINDISDSEKIFTGDLLDTKISDWIFKNPEVEDENSLEYMFKTNEYKKSHSETILKLKDLKDKAYWFLNWWDIDRSSQEYSDLYYL